LAHSYLQGTTHFYAEKKAGIPRFHIAEDLTAVTFKLLMDILAHEKVERAWTTEGQIQFT
jgi:hypothetical protein